LLVVHDAEQAKSLLNDKSNEPFALPIGQEPGDKVFYDGDNREKKRKK